MLILGRHVVHNDDVRRIKIDTSDSIVVFDPDYSKPELMSYLPENNGGILLLFSDYKTICDALNMASKKGWVFKYQFIWDCVSTWWIGKNNPLVNHRTCLWFSTDYKYDQDHSVVEVLPKWARQLKTVERFQITSSFRPHRHYKPIRWVHGLIGSCLPNRVIDMFAGSGAALFCCEKLSKVYTGYEINTETFKKIELEWTNFSNAFGWAFEQLSPIYWREHVNTM